MPLSRRSALFGFLSAPFAALGFRAQAQTQNILTIEMYEGGFHPPILEAEVGDTIQWINYDDANHQVMSDSRQFATPLLRRNESSLLELTVAGEFDYHCELHPSMTGTLRIR